MGAPKKHHTEEERLAAIRLSYEKYRASEKGRAARRRRHQERKNDPDYKEKRLAHTQTYFEANKAAQAARHKRSRHANPATRLLIEARKRAKAKGVPCSIVKEDIPIPTHCPVLGMKLRLTPTGKREDDSPSIDRVIPELGYVPGNVRVISVRANTLKNNGTVDELKAVIAYMEDHYGLVRN